MGADVFHTVGIGKTPQEAFNAAREAAAWEHGHGGYTGTIAEKPGFVLFTLPPRLSAAKFEDWITSEYALGDAEARWADELRWVTDMKRGTPGRAERLRRARQGLNTAKRKEAQFWKKIPAELHATVKRAAAIYNEKWDECVALELKPSEIKGSYANTVKYMGGKASRPPRLHLLRLGLFLMHYDLVRPCPHCPFRNDRDGYLRPERAVQIATDLAMGAEFACHQTTEPDEDGMDMEAVESSQFCAGALIMLEKGQQANQMMRIAERLGLYDAAKLDMSSPVCESAFEFAEVHGGGGACCSVCNDECEAPAGILVGGTVVPADITGPLHDCPSCGEPVCDSCSGPLGECDYCAEEVTA